MEYLGLDNLTDKELRFLNKTLACHPYNKKRYVRIGNKVFLKTIVEVNSYGPSNWDGYTK